MIPILINKDVFEPSYNDLKLTVCWGPLMDQNLLVQSERTCWSGVRKWKREPEGGREGGRQREREREREREKETGPKLWWSKGILLAEMQAYISLVRWLLNYYTEWNFINSYNMDSLIHTRLLMLKRVTACLILWPQFWELHAALLVHGIGTDKEQIILEK